MYKKACRRSHDLKFGTGRGKRCKPDATFTDYTHTMARFELRLATAIRREQKELRTRA